MISRVRDKKGWVIVGDFTMLRAAIVAMPSARLRRLGGEFFWVGFGQVLVALGGLIGVRLLTGVLDPANYGKLALGMTLATLTHQVILSPLIQAFLRFFAPAQEANKLNAYLQGGRVLLSQAMALIIGIAALCSLGLWVFGHTEWLGLVLAAFMFSVLSGYNYALDNVQTAARQRAIVAWHQGLREWLRFFIAVALIALLGAFSSIAMLGYALASVLMLGSQLVFFRRKTLSSLHTEQSAVTQKDAKEFISKMRRFAWPFVSWGIFTWAQVSSDRWALQTFRGSSVVGLYAVLYQIGYYPIMLVSGLISQFMSPVLFSRAGDGSDPRRMYRTYQLNNLLILGTIVLTLLGTILAFLLHTQIFSLLVAAEYRSVSSLLPLMVLSAGLYGSGQFVSLLPMSHFNTQVLIPPKIVIALLGILLNFAGAYVLGIRGVVFVSTTLSLVYFVWALHIAKPKKTSFRFGS